MGFGWTETLLIFGIILLIFGPKKLPELARNLGSSINVFKNEVSKTTESLEDGLPSDPLEDETVEADPDQTSSTPEETPKDSGTASKS